MHKFQMGRVSAIAAAAALVIGSVAPAIAAPRDPAPAKSSQEDQTAPAPKSKRYCIDSEQTGSRVPNRICKTREQWIREDGFDPIGQLSAK